MAIFEKHLTSKQPGKYYIYDKANLRVDSTYRAGGSGANEVDIGVAPTGTFSCDDHALKSFVVDEVQGQADVALNPLVDETEAITEKMLLDREIIYFRRKFLDNGFCQRVIFSSS